jgi:hypothetical protein
MSRITGALVAIEYDDGETHLWRLRHDVQLDETFTKLLHPAPSSTLFDIRVTGYGDRTDVEGLPLPELES